MIQNETVRILVNRVMSFLIGGLLIFVVMNVTVISKLKEQNAELAEQLDNSMYEAGRLLADAQAQFANRDFTRAQETLTNLIAKHPGSSESAEGRTLYDETTVAITSENARWEAAMAGVRERWAAEMTAQIREKAEKTRQQMESDMSDTLAREWDRAKDQIRREWAKQG